MESMCRNEVEREELDARVGLLAAQLHALSAQLVDAIAEFDGVGGSEGWSSLSQWLSVRGGFSTGEARRLCTLAGRVEELPVLMGHARAGQLSVGVLAAAARIATADNDAAVAEIAVSTTPAQAARIWSTYRSINDPDPDPAPDPAAGPGPVPEPDTWWRTWFDDTGRGRIDAALSADVAALVEQAWAAARTAGDTNPPDPDRPDPDRSERLSSDEIASRWATTMLDHAHDHGLCRPGGDRHNVVVNIDVETLARVLGLHYDPALPIRLGTHAFDAATGAHLTDTHLARMLCDADLQVLVHHHGAPLWMSNTTRRVNRHQRRALRFRASGTGGCEYPGCTQTRYLDAHHVTFWSHHGTTTLDNLVLLCSHHHRALHRHEFTITTPGDQTFTFTDRFGTHLGTSTTSTGAHGPPPRHTHRPRIDHPPDPPAEHTPDTPRSITGGEPLTAFALDVYLTHLLAA